MTLSQTREERLRNMVMCTGAHPANAVVAEPATEGHTESHEPWSAPVMVLAGLTPGGDPWLYLGCHCGWWLGYAPQMDPAEFAKVSAVHGGNCKLRPAAAKAG